LLMQMMWCWWHAVYWWMICWCHYVEFIWKHSC
jgi:hypothetical protein